MKKGTFATHFWDRGGAVFQGRAAGRAGIRTAPLCKTVKTSGPILFAMKPTCRHCRFYLLAPKLGREGALERMRAEDAAAKT